MKIEKVGVVGCGLMGVACPKFLGGQIHVRECVAIPAFA